MSVDPQIVTDVSNSSAAAVLWLKCAVDLLFDPTEYNSLLNTVDVDYTNYYIY